MVINRQEGVALGIYYPKNVTVTTPSGQQLVARTYIETNNPDKVKNGTDIPMGRRPSNTYLEVSFRHWLNSCLLFDCHFNMYLRATKY